MKKKLTKRERAWRKFNFKMVNFCPIAKIVIWRACLRNVTPHGFGNRNAFAALLNAALIRTLLRTTDGKAFCCLSINRGNCQATGNRAQFLTRSEWLCCSIGEDCRRIRERRSRERRFFKKRGNRNEWNFLLYPRLYRHRWHRKADQVGKGRIFWKRPDCKVELPPIRNPRPNGRFTTCFVADGVRWIRRTNYESKKLNFNFFSFYFNLVIVFFPLICGTILFLICIWFNREITFIQLF